jgi:hypothetical protein
MLVTAKALKGYKLHCTDGEIGTVTEFIFDDRDWTIRYLAIETGTWLVDRQVLISLQSLAGVDEKAKYFSVNLTKQQIEDSPPLFKEVPVSRQYEDQYHTYYKLPAYWNTTNTWLPIPDMMGNSAVAKEAARGDKDLEPDLHSTDNVRGRGVHATDGEIGHIVDFIIDDEAWVIRYLVVTIHNWLPGKKVLISPAWIDHIFWDESPVSVNVLREKIKKSPEYSDTCELNRDYEKELHAHYDRECYWDDKASDTDKK